MENSPIIVPHQILWGTPWVEFTWDPGSAADGAGETKTSITVTGAALGDAVIVAAPYDLQDMIVTAYVQAANTVEVRLQNESGGAIDLASGTWKVKVIRPPDDLGIDCDAPTGDKAVFPIPFKCELLEAGAIITETGAGGTTTAIVKFDLRPTAGSDASRGNGDIAELALSTTAAGKVVYDLAGTGTVLNAGDEVVVELTQAATGASKAGHFRPYLLVRYLPETIANMADKVVTA